MLNYSTYHNKQLKTTFSDWIGTEVSWEVVGPSSCGLEEPISMLLLFLSDNLGPSVLTGVLSDSPCAESASLSRPLTRCRWTQTSWPPSMLTFARWAARGCPESRLDLVKMALCSKPRNVQVPLLLGRESWGYWTQAIGWGPASQLVMWGRVGWVALVTVTIPVTSSGTWRRTRWLLTL